MKAVLRITTGLLLLTTTVVGVSGQMTALPLLIRGYAVQDGLDTKYSIEVRNVGREVVSGICVKEAGDAIHSRTFNPDFLLPTIAPGRTHTLNVWIRGNISPLPDSCQIGVRATYRIGTRTYNTFLPAWDRWKSWRG